MDEYTTRVDTYDLAYRPVTSTFALPETEDFEQSLDSLEFSTTYTYTADGQIAGVSLPAVVDSEGEVVLGAERVTTEYDTASLPEWMSGGFGWGTYVASSRFAAEGRLVALDLGTTYATRLGYSYDDLSERLQGITLSRERHGVVFDLKYSYDDAGNVLSIQDQSASTSEASDNQCFGYDGLQRLTLAWTSAATDCAFEQGSITAGAVGGVSPYWTEYSYDTLGNRAQMVEHGLDGEETETTHYTYGAGTAGPHQVTSVTEAVPSGDPVTTSFSYDGAGNRISSSVHGTTDEYHWDAEGELTSAQGDQYTYDAFGSRLLRKNDAGLTVYLPGGQEIFIENDSEDSPVSATRYYAFSGQVVAVRTSGGLSGVMSLVSDHQGSLIAAVPNSDHSVNAVKRVYTDPFGGARDSSDELPGDRGFLGAVEDGTGLTMLGARYYDPHIGSFISVDPILRPNSPEHYNAYSYAFNNPVSLSDPSGLEPRDKNGNFDGNPYRGSGNSGSSSSPNNGGGAAPPVPGAGQVSTLCTPTPFDLANMDTWDPGARDAVAIATGFLIGAGVTAAIVGAVACGVVTAGLCVVAVAAVATVGGGVVAGVVEHNISTGGREPEGVPGAALQGGTYGLAGGAAGGLAARAIGKAASAIAGVSGRSGGAGPVLQGADGVARTIDDIEASGGEILGREVTLDVALPDGGYVRVRPDLYVRNADETTSFVEVKNGEYARLTTNQSIAYPLLNGGATFIPRGARAVEAGFESGVTVSQLVGVSTIFR